MKTPFFCTGKAETQKKKKINLCYLHYSDEPQLLLDRKCVHFSGSEESAIQPKK